MTEYMKNLLEPKLYEAIVDLALQDDIVQKCLLKPNNEKELANALVAAIICITDRELNNVEQIETILKSNPKLKEFLETNHDQLMLRKSEDTTG